MNVLHDDDGVIDHQSDGKQGQRVERIINRPQKEAHADKRQRDGDDRDQDRAEGAEEQQDHQHDDDDRLADGLEHLFDGGGDELGGIVDHRHRHAFGQIALEPGQFRAHRFGRIERVGGRRRHDADEDAFLAVEVDAHVRRLRAKLDLGYVVQAHDLVVVGAQRQGAEGLRRLQCGLRFHGEGDVFVLGLAGRGQEVGVADGLQHFCCGHSACGEPDGIDPNAHGEDLVAEHLRVRHTVHGGHLRLDHAGHVFGDFLRRHAIGQYRQVHQRECAAGSLLDDRIFGLGRQFAADMPDLGDDLGQQLVGIHVQPHVDRHG